MSKNVHGHGDDIIIQGDVQDEVFDLILATWPDVDEDSITLLEGKIR